MRRIKGVFQILGGLGIFAFSISIGVTWIAFCFGTIVIGVLLLLFAPAVLLAPFTLGIASGTAMLAIGVDNFQEGDAKGDPEAARKDCMNGQGRKPTWVADVSKCDQFLKGIRRRAAEAGVPPKFVQETIDDKEMLGAFVHYSGAMEHHQCSFTKQQEEVAASVVRQWSRLDVTKKAAYGSQVAANA
jgi:hypothetical protein